MSCANKLMHTVSSFLNKTPIWKQSYLNVIQMKNRLKNLTHLHTHILFITDVRVKIQKSQNTLEVELPALSCIRDGFTDTSQTCPPSFPAEGPGLIFVSAPGTHPTLQPMQRWFFRASPPVRLWISQGPGRTCSLLLFFFLVSFYLFTFGCVGSSLWHLGSSWQCLGFPLVVEWGLQSAGSVVVAAPHPQT